jgi:hypothetical protein
MKNILKFVLCIAIAFIITNFSINAQLREDLKREINVYIVPDSLDFPANFRGAISHRNLIIRSKKLERIFDKFNTESISRGFPDFRDEDTIKTREDGAKIKVPSLSRIFGVRLSRKEDIDSAIAELSRLPGILFAEKNLDAELNGDPDYLPK